MTPEDQIIHHCQVIATWVTKRGKAMVRREKGVFDHCDEHLKKCIEELKTRIKNEPG